MRMSIVNGYVTNNQTFKTKGLYRWFYTVCHSRLYYAIHFRSYDLAVIYNTIINNINAGVGTNMWFLSVPVIQVNNINFTCQ